jgi:Glycosyltransferase family 87
LNISDIISRFFNNPKLKWITGIVYILNAILIAIQHYYVVDRWNNFKIFYCAFPHLMAKQNLHQFFPAEYYDQFLYAPPSAVWLGLFCWLPPFISLVLWLSITSWVAWLVVYHFPKISIATKNKMAVFIFIELSTSVNNLQTNHLLAAAIVASFILLEANKVWQNNIITALAFFTKGISGAGVFLLLFYKPFWKNAIYFLITFVLVGILPGFFVGFTELPRLYTQWINLLAEDHGVNVGISLIGFVHCNITHISNVYLFQIVGLALLAITLLYLRFAKKDNWYWRLFAMNYLLVWLVLFNNAGESCGYIFAMYGIGFWYFTKQNKWLDHCLITLVVLLCMLAPTDLYPSVLRRWMQDHSIKALPVFLVWCKMHWDMITIQKPLALDAN